MKIVRYKIITLTRFSSVVSGSVSEAAGMVAGSVIESACDVDVRGADIEFVHSVIMV